MSEVARMGLTTAQLIERIAAELGVVVDRNTVTLWTRRAEHPMPVAYRGKPGQGHRYDWEHAGPWIAHELERAKAAASSESIDDMDLWAAKTVKERELARQAQLATAQQTGVVGYVAEMEAAAEDLGLTAVQMLRAIPDRIAARLAGLADEVQIAAILDAEIVAVCNQIADLGDDHARDD